MKKFLVVLLSIFSFVAIAAVSNNASAAELVDEDIVTNGDFGELSGELPFGDPVFGPEFGTAAGYGSLPAESNVVACVDPLNENNTVIRYQYSDGPFASFFKFCTLLPATTYEISLDYYLESGSTLNFGMRFAWDPAHDLVEVFYNGEATEGWQHASWEWTTDAAASYDSISVWMDTNSDVNNVGYIDNIVIKVKGTDENVVSGGDFEGFLDYAPTPTIPSDKADIHGNTSENASYGNGNLVLGAGWFHQDLGGAYSAGKYQIGLDYVASD